jgi:O-antigen ligase
MLGKYLPASLQSKPEKAAFLALAGSVSLALVSIAASEILLAAAYFGYFWIRRQHKGSIPPGMRIMLPLVAYMAWVLIAAFASSNPMLGLTVVKKFYLFLLVFLVPLILTGEGRLTWIYKAIFITAAVSSLYGLAQFIADPGRDLLHRISGFMSQWMTYSGLLMLALVLLIAYALCFGVRGHLWVIPVVVCLILALILSQTRNTLMGAMMGIAVLILMRRPRAIVALIGLVLVFYFLSPSTIKQRLKSSFDPADPNTRNRIELFQTSMRLIHDHPWLGVGPKNVKFEALKYRGHNEYPNWMYQHMHNNILQVASETGIPGLILWLWFMFRLAWDALCTYRFANRCSFYPSGERGRKEALMASSAALGAWAALMVAGMFEYNFGDSEVLILFLFIVSAPYAFAGKSIPPAATADHPAVS